jgi:hypothetical protein
VARFGFIIIWHSILFGLRLDLFKPVTLKEATKFRSCVRVKRSRFYRVVCAKTKQECLGVWTCFGFMVTVQNRECDPKQVNSVQTNAPCAYDSTLSIN